jgi:hypothetical protein
MVVVVALMALAARPGEAQNPGKTCADFNDVIFAMCTGEFVAITGEICVDVYEHLDAAGGAHISSHATIHGTAVGLTSGNVYQFQTDAHIDANGAVGNNLQQEATIIADANLISQGSLPNERATITGHATMNANGNITALDADVTDVCKG